MDKDFETHILEEHNYKDYIRYFFVLRSLDEKELNADQTYIKKCMEQEDISFFPVTKSIYLKTSLFDDDD